MTPPPLLYSEILEGFNACGIRDGDTVLVHSALKSLGPVLNGASDVIDALLAATGLDEAGHAEGTVLFPTFSFAFCSTGVWDARTSPSDMGGLTEAARLRPRARRVPHPIYSFAALGADADDLGDLRPRAAFGPGSAFEYLREVDGLILLIGLDYHRSMTFFHHVEEVAGVDYRYPKDFPGRVTYADGSVEHGVWSMQVRDWDRGVVTSVNPMGALLEAEGVVRKVKIGAATVRAMRAREVFQLTMQHIDSARGLLYRLRTPEEARAWNNEQMPWE